MHNIVKRGSRDFYCTVCHQQWVSASKAYCPGLPVYSHVGGNLLTKNQLSAKGYSVTKNALPPPVACYRGYDDYVMLYDPAQAKKKALRKTPRATYYLEAVFWPTTCFGMLDEYLERKRERDHPIAPLMMEIADMAVHLGCFNEDEAKAHTDGVMLKLTPAMTVHRHYENRFWEEREKLVARLSEAYKQWTWKPKSLSEEEIEQRRIRKEEIEIELQAREVERRTKLFEMPDWITRNEGNQPPPSQLTLFD